MPLDGDILGAAINTIESDYNEVDIADIDAARLALNKRVAWAIIEHFKTNGVVNVTVATTGTAAAQAGTGTGTIE